MFISNAIRLLYFMNLIKQEFISQKSSVNCDDTMPKRAIKQDITFCGCTISFNSTTLSSLISFISLGYIFSVSIFSIANKDKFMSFKMNIR